MMKTFTSAFCIFILAAFCNAQNFVSTTPSKKRAILEEFTGVKCPACPSGHTTVDNLKSTHGDNFIAIGLHPFNSSLTSPHSGDEDLRRSYCDAFYTNPYYGNGDGRAMPSGHVNRRKGLSGSRKLSTSAWSSRVSEILSEDSPLNVAALSDLDTATNTLDINIEIYYTDNVTSENLIHVYLVESNIYTTQSGGSSNYQQNHVFREAIHQGQWGESLGTSFTTGQLISKTYSFDLTNYNYDPEHCEIVVFVTDGTTEEIITGVETIADLTIPASISEQNNNALSLMVYPNPANETINLSWEHSNTSDVSIFNLQGQLVRNIQVNANRLTMDVRNIPKGTYNVQMKTDKGISNKRLVIQ
ncbi:MAG: Omp28-related outer membrane protein [Flavobacteriales bacterium]|nr:Omp28-related outer membrane protein [Flavobacteriales bacterium]